MQRSVYDLRFDETDNELTRVFKNYIGELNFLIDKADECLKLINDYDEIGDIKFFQRVKEFGIDSEFKMSEYADIIGIANNTKYSGRATIMTTFKRETVEEEGHGKDLEYVKVTRPVSLDVLYKNDINTDYIYSSEEIYELLASGDIFILKTNTEWDRYPYGYVECPKFDVVFRSGRKSSYEFEDPEGKYYDQTVKYMRTKMSKEKLISIYNKLKEKIDIEREIMHNLEDEFKKLDYEKRIGNK